MKDSATFTVFGQRLTVLYWDHQRQIAYVYGWRDVIARPVTRMWIYASPS